MNRRAILAMTGVPLSASLGGCLSTIRDDPGSASVEQKEYPPRPETLTNDSINSFVEEYEGTKQYNERISPNTAELNIGCRTAVDIQRGDNYYTITRCMGSDTVGEGRSTVVGELGTVPIFHEVTSEKVYRAERSSDSPDLSITRSTGIGFRVVSFLQEETRVTITIRGENANDTPIFDEDSSVEAESYHEWRSIVDEPDTYYLTVELVTGPRDQYEWNVSTLDPRVGLNIYLTADGHIEFGTLDEPY